MLSVLQSVTVWQRSQSSAQYVEHLVAGPPTDVRTSFFDFPRVFLHRYDVFHVHWPERIWRTASPARSRLKAALFLLALVVMRLRRTAIVRTVHNVAPHSGAAWWERPVLRLADRWTDVAILLNHDVPERFAGRFMVTIPHPHYGPVVDRVRPLPPPEAGRLLYFGHIQPYKNVDHLIETFAAVDDPAATLWIVGRPADDDTAQRLRAAAARDPRVHLELVEVPDADLVAHIARAELVVLPYRNLYNSGSVLMALSVGRPVLVPDVETMAELRDEVGPEWVRTYAGELRPTDLVDARPTSTPDRETLPAMTHRNWAHARERTELTYRWAVLVRTDRYPEPSHRAPLPAASTPAPQL
ncbi:glycosyltransferase [Jatrophihabitans sp. YIM 134969]